jgi:hypothetical protein
MASWLLMLSARVDAMVLEIEARRRALDRRGPRHQVSLMLILSAAVVVVAVVLKGRGTAETETAVLPSFISLPLLLLLLSAVSVGSVVRWKGPPPKSNRGTMPIFRSVRPSYTR